MEQDGKHNTYFDLPEWPLGSGKPIPAQFISYILRWLTQAEHAKGRVRLYWCQHCALTTWLLSILTKWEISVDCHQPTTVPFGWWEGQGMTVRQ